MKLCTALALVVACIGGAILWANVLTDPYPVKCAPYFAWKGGDRFGGGK